MIRLDTKQTNRVVELGQQVEMIKQETIERNVYWGKGPSLADSRDLTYADFSECMAETIKESQYLSTRKSIRICHEINWEKDKVWQYMWCWPIYRAIRRHLRRRVLWQHHPCINKLMYLGGAYVGFECKAQFGCTLSYAYILWRIYWENRQNIASLNLDMPVAIDWEPPIAASKEASLSIFANECLNSFWAIYDYASEQDRKGEFCLRVPERAEGEMFSQNWAIDQGGHDERILVWGRQSFPVVKLSHPELSTHFKAVSTSRQGISDMLLRRNANN